MPEKLARWFFFGVVIALLPFVLSYLNLRASKTSAKPIKIENLFARGELLLVSIAIGAAAIGELIGVDNAHALGKIVVAGLSLVVVMIQAFWYVSASDPHSGFDADFVGRVSVILFGVTLLSSIACLLLAGV